MTLPHTLLRRALFCLVAGTVVLGASACQPTSSLSAQAYAPSTQAQQVLSLLNDYRVANGLAPLDVAADATAKAQAHSDDMAAAGSLFHSSDLSSGIDPGWTMLGENVGVGSTADEVQSTFEASGPHNDNMLNPAYNQVGIGATNSSDGRIWITQFFVAR